MALLQLPDGHRVTLAPDDAARVVAESALSLVRLTETQATVRATAGRTTALLIMGCWEPAYYSASEKLSQNT